jgi:enamine deaminase RidA (YjgF/YER057c/UK114 family)
MVTAMSSSPKRRRIIYIAGQGGENAEGELSDDFKTQVAQALEQSANCTHRCWCTPYQREQSHGLDCGS